ncbi:MAG: SRPBCC family protein, partial [Hyphomicrobiales bacterium]|nr:SRPBCC family protein [Hyphomicrobiales bacterium]
MNKDNERQLTLTRLIEAPREKLFRAWTDPKLMEQWFCPKPWFVSDVQIDLRPGGAFFMFINGPGGERFPNRGVYLDVVVNERIVFTDAYTDAWTPSEKPFFTAIVTFEDEGGKTRYTARALHWSAADREQHEKMGFHEGWGKAADQLAEL